VKVFEGKLDPGEEPLAAAKREPREETGLHGGEWAEVAAVYASPGFTDERFHVFVATGLAEGEAEQDAKTLAGLLLYLRR
jgi:ADP-ribose pyrophosphatase